MKNIVFDLDGTLADTSGDLIAAANFCFENMGYGPLLNQKTDKLTAFHGGRAMLRKGLEREKIIFDEEVIDSEYHVLLDYYSENIDKETYLYDGVLDALERLRNNGFNLGVCTNKPEDLAENLLRKLNIRDYFKAMLGADTLNVRKPHPRHLLETIKQIGGLPETSVLIGDTETDRRAAENANVTSILVTFGPEGMGIKRLKANGYLDHYDDLENVLAQLSQINKVI